MELALDILPHVLVDGIVLGFMYALIALGYTMVYGVLEFINFAHSEIFVLGAFVGVEILLLLESAGHLATLHPGFVLLLVIGAAVNPRFNPDGLGSAFTALPIQIFAWTQDPNREFVELAAAAILVMMVVLLLMNSVAIFLRNRYEQKW